MNSVQAETPVFRPKKHTCSELRDELRNYGRIGLVEKFLFIPQTTYVSPNPFCNVFQIKRRGFFKTKDKKKCEIGYYCEGEQDSSPSSHGMNICELTQC